MNIPQPNMNGPLPKMDLNITLDKTEPMLCTCGNDIFVSGVMFRRISKILTGTSKDGVIPIEVYICSKCNTPLEDTIPPALKNTPKITS